MSIPDGWAYRRASRLIQEHGDDAMTVADQLVAMALRRRQSDRAALMLRVRTAVAKLQEPPRGPLH